MVITPNRGLPGAIATPIQVLVMLLPLVGGAAPAYAQLAAPPNDPAVCLDLVRAAEAAYAQAPLSPFTLEQIGDAAFCQKDMMGAVAHYSEAIAGYEAIATPQAGVDALEADLAIPTAYFKLAQAQIYVDNSAGALAAFQQGIARDPFYGYLPYFSSRQYLPLGEPITDGSFVGTPYPAPITVADSVEASAYFELGYALTQVGDSVGAVEAFQQAIARDPDFAYAYNSMAEAMSRSFGAYDRAAAYQAWEQALKLDPDLVWAYYNRGYAHAWEGDATRAFADFRRVVDYHTSLTTLGADYKDAIAFRMVGDVYMEQGNGGPAIDAYQAAERLDPDFAPGVVSLGKAYLMVGNLEAAMLEFQIALGQLPEAAIEDRADVYHQLGITYMLQEQWDLARASLETARSLNPALSADIQLTLDYINSRPPE